MHKRAHQFHDFIQHIDKNYLLHHKIFFLFILLPLFIFYGIFNAVFYYSAAHITALNFGKYIISKDIYPHHMLNILILKKILVF